MTDTIQLRGITWGHTRGFLPMVASAQRFTELRPHVEITWDKRSLQAFADQPIEGLAKAYDFLVIDHPWAGFAASHGILLPLDEWISSEYLSDQADHSVGASHASYASDGHQWALAIDAATPVASYRPDLFEQHGLALPENWDDLLALAETGRVAVPGVPIDTLMNFYALCTAEGESPFQSREQVVSHEVGVRALKRMGDLAGRLSPECFDWNPIQLAEAMTRRDDLAYCPFAYGYSNYSREGYAPRALKYTNPPWIGGRPMETTLGGTGLAVSSKCRHREAAAAYVQLVADPVHQRTVFFDSGGQPAHRGAWTDGEVNRRSHNFFRDTLDTLDRAFLRPRYDGYLDFQDHGGTPIRTYLMEGGSEDRVLQTLDEMYTNSLPPA